VDRLAFGVFLAISAVRAWGSTEFWTILCYGWSATYEIPGLVEMSKESRRQNEIKKAANPNNLIYFPSGNIWAASTLATGSIFDPMAYLPAISQNPGTGTLVINSLKSKSTIQGYYFVPDLNIEIASSKYPNFLMTTLLKCLFNVQWVPGPKP
jgi:hypothetical protein